MSVTYVSAVCAYLRGWGSRELLTELTGRPPIWSVQRRAWVAQEHTARDAVAAAEVRGWWVDVLDERALDDVVAAEKAEEAGVLW